MNQLTNEQNELIRQIVEIDTNQGDWDFSLELLKALFEEIPFSDLDESNADYGERFRTILKDAYSSILLS